MIIVTHEMGFAREVMDRIMYYWTTEVLVVQQCRDFFDNQPNLVPNNSSAKLSTTK